MGDERDKYGWIEDFSIRITRRGILSLSRDPDLELYTGSKLLASLWLAAVAGMAGALGGVVVSGALWAFLLYPVVWLLVVAAVSIIVWQVTRRLAGSAVAFLAGWCIFWGVLTGVAAGWGAQLGGAGWAYGIAGGLGFLVGITHGNLRHADIEGHDGWFMTGTVLAPASTCLAAWLSRSGLISFGEWQQVGFIGLIASLLFLGPVMALYLARWNNKRALLRLSSLYLHNDDFIGEAIALLDRAIKLSPNEAALFDRRALAHALKGDMASAEADWARHKALSKNAPDLSLGWSHLRQERLDLAAEAFTRAAARNSTRHWGTVGRALVHLRKGEPALAIDLLRALPQANIDARNQTYLAQGHLAAGNLAQAVAAAEVAIDELDSVHGLSWLVRAEARISQGDKAGNRDHAIADLNRALAAADEAGIEERALAGLEKIEGAVLEEDELEELEKSLAAR
jgi:tetratricopeptide (TPR) repeat protein